MKNDLLFKYIPLLMTAGQVYKGIEPYAREGNLLATITAFLIFTFSCTWLLYWGIEKICLRYLSESGLVPNAKIIFSEAVMALPANRRPKVIYSALGIQGEIYCISALMIFVMTSIFLISLFSGVTVF